MYFLGRGKLSWGSNENPFPVSLHLSSALTGDQLFLLLSQLFSAHSVSSLSNLFATRALGLIQRGLRQRWPVHGSAADKISAWSLAHSRARNSSSHGSCWWAMLSSGEGCNFLEGSQAGQSGDVQNSPSPPGGCSPGLRPCLRRDRGEDSPSAGGVPSIPGLAVRCCRLHTGLLNSSLTSLAVTYPRCLVTADKKTLPSLAWFDSRYFTSVWPLCPSTRSAWVMAAGRGSRAATRPCWDRALEAREGQTQSVLSVGDIGIAPWRKGTFYLRVCDSRRLCCIAALAGAGPRASISRSRRCASARAHSPHAGKGQTRLYFVMRCRAPLAVSEEEYLLVRCTQVLSISMQAYHSQVLVIRISRWTFFSLLFQDFSSWWLMSNVFW